MPSPGLAWGVSALGHKEWCRGPGTVPWSPGSVWGQAGAGSGCASGDTRQARGWVGAWCLEGGWVGDCGRQVPAVTAEPGVGGCPFLSPSPPPLCFAEPPAGGRGGLGVPAGVMWQRHHPLLWASQALTDPWGRHGGYWEAGSGGHGGTRGKALVGMGGTGRQALWGRGLRVQKGQKFRGSENGGQNLGV